MSTSGVDQERVWRLLVDVVTAAHHHSSHADEVQLLDVIKAHRRLSLSRAVPRIVADEAYRTFLRLSVDADTDWWAKLDMERMVSSGRLLVLDSARLAVVSWNFATQFPLSSQAPAVCAIFIHEIMPARTCGEA
jgi:hypothetical protein